MKFLITVPLAVSTVIRQFNWLSSDCIGSPSSILTLDTSNSTVYNQVVANAPITYCGFKLLTVAVDSCCHSAIAPDSYQGFALSYDLTQNPKLAGNYCELTNYSNYTTALVLSDSSCVESLFQCGNGNFTIFSLPNCQGTRESYVLSSTVVDQTSATIGTFSMRSTAVDGGDIRYAWTAFYPGNLYFPLNKNPLEAFGTICLAAGLLLSFASAIFFAWKLFRRFFKINFLLFVSHCLWTIYVAFYIYFLYLVSNDVTFFCGIQEVNKVFYNLATLFTILINAYMLIDIVFKPKTYVSVIFYASIVAIHLGLAGFSYFVFWTCGNNSGSLLKLPITKWKLATTAVWEGFVFAFDTLATIIITYHIIRSNSYYHVEGFWIAMRRGFSDIRLLGPILGQILTLGVYYFLYFSARYTTMAGNDRGYTGLENIRLTLFIIHSAISSFSVNQFRLILKDVMSEKNVVKRPTRVVATSAGMGSFAPFFKTRSASSTSSARNNKV